MNSIKSNYAFVLKSIKKDKTLQPAVYHLKTRHILCLVLHEVLGLILQRN